MRHVAPVDGQTGAREVRGAGESDAAAGRQLAERPDPVGGVRHPTDAFGQSDGADAKIVRGQRAWLLRDAQTEVGRVDGQLLRDLVDLDFLTETRLWRAMSALGTTRRLVREDAAPLKLVCRDVVRDRLQRT